MTRVHAFTDDALGDLDAVGLVEHSRPARCPIPEVVEAAIARTEQVDDALGAVAHARLRPAPAREARDPRGGFFAGVPTFVKDNVDVAGMPTMQGTRRVDAAPGPADGDFARMYLATGLVPLGKTQLSEFGFSASAEHPRLGPGAHAVGPRAHRRRVLGRLGGAGRRRGGADRPRQRRRRLDPDPGRRSTGWSGSSRPAAGSPQDALMRQMPVRIVADGVVTRSVRDTAAFFREAEQVYRNLRLPPIGDVTRPGPQPAAGRGEHRGHRPRRRRRGHRADLADRALLEDLGHTVEQVDAAGAGRASPTTSSSTGRSLALALVRGGRRAVRPDLGRRRSSTTSPSGWPRHAARNLTGCRARSPGCAAAAARPRRFFDEYDVALTPDAGDRDARRSGTSTRPRTTST